MDMLFIFRSWDEREPYPHELVIVRLMRGLLCCAWNYILCNAAIKLEEDFNEPH